MLWEVSSPMIPTLFPVAGRLLPNKGSTVPEKDSPAPVIAEILINFRRL
jgi:hypothetical protein